MRDPFVRPFFAWFFYLLAAVWLGAVLLLGIALTVGGATWYGPTMAAIMAAYGVVLGVVAFLQASFCAAIGFVIEKVAKIEWNTRPNELGGYATSAPAGAPAGTKLYYYIDKGPLRGPLTAPELLNLYRDGKLSIAARFFVEENGQRRALENLSEINR